MPYATHILKKARQFHDDKSGATAVIFGVAATMLVTVMGAAIDTARMIQAKNKIQASADTAVLMAKKTETQLRTTMSESAAKTQATARAKEFFEASIGDAKTYFEGNKVNFDLKFGLANDATLNVDGDYKFIVGNFVGLQKQKLAAKAVAQFKEPDDVEVVLALDMTGSMFEKDGRPTTRFTLLRNASKTFTHMLFDASKDVGKDYIRVGVVPWGTTVNILSEAPAAPDFNGSNSVSSMPDAGSRTLIASPLSRASDVNFDNADYAPVNWRGCLIGLTEPMGTYNDFKHNAPFKPMITPRTSLPKVNIKIRNACDTQTYARRSFSAGSYGNTNVYLKDPQQTTALTSSSSTCQFTSTADIKTTEPCVSDPNEVAFLAANPTRWCPWVTDTKAKNWTDNVTITGPNVSCPVPMLGLSANRAQVIGTLDRMYPTRSYTHADVGLRWGLRALSPEWGSFFGLTKAPTSYTSYNKIMILITDGENTQAQMLPGYWGCSDNDYAGCNGAPNVSELNTRMMNWCSSIKNNYGVKLITIALNVTNSSAVQLLKDCASADGAFSIDAKDLEKTLKEIAATTVLKLKLTQ